MFRETRTTEMGAYEAKGEVSGGATILGVQFSATAGGSVLSAHAGIGRWGIL